MSSSQDSTRDAGTDPETPAEYGSSVEAPLGRFGDFALQAEVGTDGPFTLYRARQPRLNRTVLLKVPTERELLDDNVPWFLRREAEVCGMLDHPCILRVLESGEANGIPYIAFAAVDGPSLATYLGRGPIPARQALNWLRSLCEALFQAHRQQVIHANLRPEYVFVQRDGQVRLTGFGTGDRPAEINGYLAPDRLPGFSKRITEKADVYGLGAILYGLLTGRPPHVANDQAKLAHAVRTADIVPPRRISSGISRDLDALCRQCLIREPYRRYSVKPLMSDVLRYLSGRPVLARSGLWWRTPLAWTRRNRRTLSTVVAILLGIVLPNLWQSWRTASAWQALMTEPPVAEWTLLQPSDDVDQTGLKSANANTLVIRTSIPNDVRFIQALRLEPVVNTASSGQLSEQPSPSFILTDVRGLVGEQDLRRSVHFGKAHGDHDSPGFPASATIDDQPEHTGWSYGHASGSAHNLDLLLADRTAVIPGEPLSIHLTFGILTNLNPSSWRVFIRSDAPQAAIHQRNVAQAIGYFQRQYVMNPHDDPILIGSFASQLLFGSLPLHYVTFFPMDDEKILDGKVRGLPCADPYWNRTWRQLFGIAALRDGGYSKAMAEFNFKNGDHNPPALNGYSRGYVRIQADNSRGEPRLAAEFERLRNDGDVLARSIDLSDSAAIVAAGQVEATPELVRSLLQRLADYVPIRTLLPTGSQPFLTWNRDQRENDPETIRRAAAVALQQTAFEWRFHPGARRAIPALAEQLADPNVELRKVALELLQEIDPDWHRLREAREAIPGLVLRSAHSSEIASSEGTHSSAIETLNRIDLEWRKSPEALRAIPVLLDVLRFMSQTFDGNSGSMYYAGPQHFRPNKKDPLFISQDPMTAINVLLELGPGAKTSITELRAIQEGTKSEIRPFDGQVGKREAASTPAHPKVRQAIQAALDELAD